MTAQLIDGTALSRQIRAEVAQRAQALTARGHKPGLAVILVGEDPASAVYVRNKVKACQEHGLHSVFEKYDASLGESELLARIEALLRRSRTLASNSAGAFSFGEIDIDFRSAEVRRHGAPVELSGLELKLLRYLVEHRGAVLTRDELLEKVWGYDAMPVTRTVDVHIASLRQKLEANPARPQHIVTLHGLGYKFVG